MPNKADLQTEQRMKENYKDLPSKALIEKLNQLIKHNKHTFTDKDRVIFTKINTLDDKKRDYETHLGEIQHGKERLFACFGTIKRPG